MAPSEPNTDILDNRIDAALERRGGNGHPPSMITREELDAKFDTVKTAVDGLRHSQTVILGVVAVLAAIMIGAFGYTYSRIDRLEDKIDALPGELRGIADSLTGAITATRQQPVIILQQPAAGNLLPPDATPQTAPKQ